MTYHPRHSETMSAYSAFDAGDEYAQAFDVAPGERIGAPLARKRTGLRWAIMLFGSLGAGWAALNGLLTMPQGVSDLVASLSSAREQSVAPSNEMAAKPETAPAAVAPLPEQVVQQPATPPTATVNDKPAAAASTEEPAAQTNATAETIAAAEAAPPDANPPFKQPELSPNADRYQRQAMAVGLHPELSHALLVRLTKVDYRNAGYAIKTALADTADDAVMAWPREAKARQAVFKVHFVAGANTDCRRYVVTVTLDNWETTAHPMEKCKAQHPPGKAANAAAASAGTRGKDSHTPPPAKPISGKSPS